MNLEDLSNELETIGVPVTYRQFEKDHAPDPPFIIFYDGEKIGFSADNIDYFTRLEVFIELYTDYKDEKLEEKIEKIFRSQNIRFESEAMYWDEERMHEVLYRAVIF